MRVRGRDDDVGRESSVRFAAQQPDRRCVTAVVAVDRRVDQHPTAEQVRGCVGADRGHSAGDVAALYPREPERAAPAGLGVGPARKAVGALAGPDVRVVDRGCVHADQDLAGAGGRHRPVASDLQGVGFTVAGQNGSRHHLIHRLIRLRLRRRRARRAGAPPRDRRRRCASARRPVAGRPRRGAG